jgi:hypothetical protein
MEKEREIENLKKELQNVKSENLYLKTNMNREASV